MAVGRGSVLLGGGGGGFAIRYVLPSGLMDDVTFAHNEPYGGMQYHCSK